jgi:hypothetical protein
MPNVTVERACNSEIMMMMMIIKIKLVVYSVWPGKNERAGGGVPRNSWDEKK